VDRTLAEHKTNHLNVSDTEATDPAIRRTTRKELERRWNLVRAHGSLAPVPITQPIPEERIVAIVDDDASVRQSARRLMRSLGYRADAFGSAEEFLTSGRLADTACLILDVRMPGATGLQLQEQLIASGSTISIIFITAHGDEDARSRALELGAIDFL